jgi:hypothetical protein
LFQTTSKKVVRENWLDIDFSALFVYQPFTDESGKGFLFSEKGEV